MKIKEAILVEGRYDKNALSQVVDTVIIETNGFEIFSDKEKIALLRAIAEKRGLVVLTDGDGAGFVIRNNLKGQLPSDKIKHAYIPDIRGKEKRKRKASKEGKLGVEGMTSAVLREALLRSGVTVEQEDPPANREKSITKMHLYEAGRSGKEGSEKRRQRLIRALNLPERLSANALLDVLNALYTFEEFSELLQRNIFDDDGSDGCYE
jgi:ribonuclease M5